MKVAIVDIGNGVAQINSGKMRSIAISAQARSPAAPNVPPLEEVFPNVEAASATIMSQEIAMVMPPPRTSPLIAAIDGFPRPNCTSTSLA